MLHCLLDFYLSLLGTFKLAKSDEGYCTALNFLIETIILASGCESSNSLIALSLVTSEELSRAKELIRELITSVAGRIKGQDSVV